jgi:hypothetical protein
MPLQEALQKKKVRIKEKDQGGTVNTLSVENVSSDTIIIICGDVVKGGQQDRIIQKDMVLSPKSGKKDLSVFCVESGRWSPRSAAAAAPSLRNAYLPPPAAPEFKEHYNKGTMSLRKVVEKEKDQSRVWSKVEDITIENKTLSPTKTYTALTSSSAFSRKLNGYLKFFKDKFLKDSGVVGVVVVTGTKVLGCDLFATPALFQGQFPSLLHSYATEAILSGKPVTATPAVVKAYMDALLKDEATQKTTLEKKGTAFEQKGKRLRVSCYD